MYNYCRFHKDLHIQVEIEHLNDKKTTQNFSLLTLGPHFARTRNCVVWWLKLICKFDEEPTFHSVQFLAADVCLSDY